MSNSEVALISTSSTQLRMLSMIGLFLNYSPTNYTGGLGVKHKALQSEGHTRMKIMSRRKIISVTALE